MPDTELPDLTAAEDLQDDDLAYVVQGGAADRKATIAQLRGDPAARLVALDELSPLTEEDLLFVVRGAGSPLEYTAYRTTVADLIALAPTSDFDPGYTTPVDGDFAWSNQGGASITTLANGGLFLRAPAGSAINLRCRVKAAPATPYSVIARIEPLIGGVNTSQLCGLLFSDGTKLVTLAVTSAAMARVTRWNNTGSYSADSLVRVGRPAGWFKIEDDGTNLKYYVGNDGENWILMFSQARGNFLSTGPTHIGWFVNSEEASQAIDAAATLLSWEETT
jgi:hypothetical protein